MSVNKVIVNGVAKLDLTNDTVNENENLLSGAIAHNAAGETIIGKVAITNPNLLINPDFRVNQRRQMEYNVLHNEYSVDRWMTNFGCSVFIHNKGIRVVSNGMAYSGIWQRLEPQLFRAGEQYTPSVFFNETPPPEWYIDVHIVNQEDDIAIAASSNYNTANMSSGLVALPPLTIPTDGEYYVRFFICNKTTTVSTIDIGYAKIEKGSIATSFVKPDPATELTKCQRYYQIRTTGDVDPVDLRPSMRITPTVTQLDNGNYAYNAEL